MRLLIGAGIVMALMMVRGEKLEEDALYSETKVCKGLCHAVIAGVQLRAREEQWHCIGSTGAVGCAAGGASQSVSAQWGSDECRHCSRCTCTVPQTGG